jgi:hypothetical protein
VVERLSRDAFRSQYGVEPAPASQWQGTGDDVWYDTDDVQVADYFYKTWEDVELVQFPNGTVVPTKDIGEIDPTWPKRATRIPTVWWAKMCGSAVLSKTIWLGQHIPIIRVEGTRLDVDGKTIRTGIIQQTLTSQLAYDYAFCAEMEALALAPKAPYIAAAEQIAEYKEYWDRANDPYRPYLPYKPLQGIPPPQRQSVEPAIQALTLARQQAAQDMQAVLGVYSASLGEPSNERSGVAIDSRKVEGDQATYHFPANLGWSIRALGLQIVDILPKLYSRPTTLRQIGTDGSVQMTKVNQMDAQSEDEQRLLSKGSYDVTVSSGPSYETNRMEAAEKLGTMLAAVQPEVQSYFLDMWAGTLDFPNSDELAQRFRTLVPPAALSATESNQPEQQVVQLQNQLKQAAEQLQMLQQQLQQTAQTEQVATQQMKLLEQEVAAARARLADKQAENQLQAMKQQQEYEIDLAKLRLEEQKFMLSMQQSQNEQVEHNGV